MVKIVILGAGGHGAEIAWNIAELNRQTPVYDVLGFCDDAVAEGTTVMGHPVLGSIESVAANYGRTLGYVCAVGRNCLRLQLVNRAAVAGWTAVTVIHPSAVVSTNTEIGAGSFIGPLSYVGPFVRIGRHCILNFQCSVAHGATLHDFAQVCPGARVSGGVTLGEGVFLGSNAAVAPGLTMGAWSKLSACSFAAVHVPEHALALGVPARIVPSPKVS